VKDLKKSLLVFIFSSIVDIVYFPLIFNFRHSRARSKAIHYFVEESKLPLNTSISELVRQSLRYYRLFKRLNMFLLLAGVYIKDIEIFYKTLGSASVSGLEILEQNKNKSVIGLSYHIGPFPMIPVILALKGYNSIVLVRSDTLQAQARMPIEKINESMDFLARTFNVGKVQFIDSLSTFSLVLVRKCMKDGEILMIHPDTAKESSVSSIPVGFFNTQIAGHIGVAKLCRFTRATVIPVAIRWDASNNINLNINEPLDINPDGTDEEIINEFYGSFEKNVAAHPEQWIQVESYEKLKY
jgi:lauroyl/myristoyl acyltransferase